MWLKNIKKGAIQAFAREIFIQLGIPGFALTVIISLGTALAAYWSELKPIVAFVLGLLVFATVLVILVAVVWLWDRYKNRNISQQANEYIPLSEAAASAYAELRTRGDSAHVRMADMENSPDEVINYMAIALSKNINIYGKHPPSNKLELIKKRYFSFGTFQNKGDTFNLYDNDQNEFEECSVMINDLDNAIDAVGEYRL